MTLIKPFPVVADDIEGTMTKNCLSEGSNWPLGKYSIRRAVQHWKRLHIETVEFLFKVTDVTQC